MLAPLSNTQIVEHGQVCVAQGVYLGQTMVTSSLGLFITGPLRDFKIVSEVDEFISISEVCSSKEWDKELILSGALEACFNKHMPLAVSQGFYDALLSERLAAGLDSNVQEDAELSSNRMERLSHRGLTLTSRCMMIKLESWNERLKQGDVVGIMVGMSGLSVIRLTSASHQEYTFVGPCGVLCGRSQFGTPEACFAQNDLQELRLV